MNIVIVDGKIARVRPLIEAHDEDSLEPNGYDGPEAHWASYHGDVQHIGVDKRDGDVQFVVMDGDGVFGSSAEDHKAQHVAMLELQARTWYCSRVGEQDTPELIHADSAAEAAEKYFESWDDNEFMKSNEMFIDVLNGSFSLGMSVTTRFIVERELTPSYTAYERTRFTTVTTQGAKQ